jgi:hypothetical protein
MFSRTTVLATAMLGLGTLLGYLAAWGRFPALEGSRSVAQEAAADRKAPLRTAPKFSPVQAEAGVGEKWQTPKPGNPRGATTGPTQAPGYDHPNQYLFTSPTEIAPNMEPVIVHKDQLKEAQAKLAAAAEKFGRKPNFLIFLLDDVGWMDPGFNGGGCTVGNPTPNMDKIARAARS